MTDVRQDTSDEKRRRLLKGALGASTVVTLGYGGAAAAASLSCIAKLQDAGYPTPQFVIQPTQPEGWAWTEVTVGDYKITGIGSGSGPFRGFSIEGKIYRVSDHSFVGTLGETLGLTDEGGSTEVGWVLTYFDQNGGYAGTYPEYSGTEVGSDDQVIGAATTSCEQSIVAGVVQSSFSG